MWKRIKLMLFKAGDFVYRLTESLTRTKKPRRIFKTAVYGYAVFVLIHLAWPISTVQKARFVLLLAVFSAVLAHFLAVGVFDNVLTKIADKMRLVSIDYRKLSAASADVPDVDDNLQTVGIDFFLMMAEGKPLYFARYIRVKFFNIISKGS